MSTAYPRVRPFGEAALLVELGSGIELAVNVRVHALASRLDGGADGLAGLGRTVPAYDSLLVPFDPALADSELADRLADIAWTTVAEPASPVGEVLEIAVGYGYDDGPDLGAVAAAAGISPDAVIDIHRAATYRVFMLGFSPGFAYLGPLPEVLRLPRRVEPRLRVPAGSVAIAGAQTAVYPHVTAGGWHLIGRTDEVLWDPAAPEPARLRPGARVRFVPA